MTKEEEFLKLISGLPKKEKAVITKAFKFAKKMHAGQKRQSGDDYFIHPLSEAFDLEKRFYDYELTSAALLHDTSEDCSCVTPREIYSRFGKKIGFLVDAVTKDTSKYYKMSKVFKSKIGKLLWGGIKDFRVLVLKIADREHNLTDLGVLVPNKQIKISFETQAIYYPLREILNFKFAKSLEEIRDRFVIFLKEEMIRDQHDFRSALFKCSFSEMDRKMFDIIYGNTDKILWQVEDKKFYQSLLENKGFSRAVKNVTLWSDGERFRAMFSFEKGLVVKSELMKFNILGINFFK
jgi:GTP pyrophosphokinase